MLKTFLKEGQILTKERGRFICVHRDRFVYKVECMSRTEELDGLDSLGPGLVGIYGQF